MSLLKDDVFNIKVTVVCKQIFSDAVFPHHLLPYQIPDGNLETSFVLVYVLFLVGDAVVLMAQI